MRPRIENEKGYTLLLAVLIGVLFSIMIVTLVTLTMSGISKNDIREDNQQATGLSQKGLTHINNYINDQLKSEIGDEGILQEDFIDELEALLDRLSCDSGTKLYNDNEKATGDYAVCVDSWKSVLNGEGEEIPTRKEVIFKSNSVVDGVEKELFSTVIIGAQAIPDVLNYAIGSHCANNSCNEIPGEGNLFLHGGVQIEGDMKVDGDVVTSDYGYAYLSGERWINSLYPTIKPGPGNKYDSARLVLGGDVYTFHSNPPRGYAYHIARSDFNGYEKVTNQLNRAFTIAPEIIDRAPIRDKLDVGAYVDESNNWINDVDVQNVNQATFNNTKNQYSNSKVNAYIGETKRGECIEWGYILGIFPYCKKYGDSIVETSGTIYLQGENTFEKFGTKNSRNVTINNNKKNNTSLSVKSGMYVDGDLTIGNPAILNYNESYRNNPSNYDGININGTLFVNGDLNIIGADANLNALIYVNGKVDIQYSRINGLNVSGKEGSLIVFANDEIFIRNNSVNQDTASNIRGYFYSNKTFEMFGVGSNIKINGGISARRIVLNGIRGRASDNSRTIPNYQTFGGSYFEGVSGQKTRDSRLQVIYNPGIIGTYSDLKLEEPIIYNLDPPQLIERE